MIYFLLTNFTLSDAISVLRHLRIPPKAHANGKGQIYLQQPTSGILIHNVNLLKHLLKHLLCIIPNHRCSHGSPAAMPP